MDHLRDQTLNLDSPSKLSYVGSYHKPPEKLSNPSHTHRERSDLQHISPQLYRAAPDAGSRAVIAALKTLQEKMRRLELERIQAEKNGQQFSRTAQHRTDTSAQKEQLHRESDSTQRKELMSKLRSTETRCSLLEKQLDYMRRMVECAERERITQRDRREPLCTESPHKDLQIQAQLSKLEKLEKEYHKLTSTQSMADRKIELLEQKLLKEEHERKLVQEKAEKLQRELENNLLSLSDATHLQGKKKKKKDKALCKDKTSTYCLHWFTKSPSMKAEAAPSQYPLKNKRLPFVAGTSTSPSHSVNANVQSVLHMMKHRNPRLCERIGALQRSGPEDQQAQRRPASSPSKGASALGSLSELLLALQDELGQMSFEHQELVRQIDETDKRELREDLERELDCLVRRMEEKAGQISKLRKHQQTVLKLSQPSSSPRQTRKNPRRTPSVERKSRMQTGVQPLPPSPVKASPGKGQRPSQTSQEQLRLLRETQRLCSSLRKQDITWET